MLPSCRKISYFSRTYEPQPATKCTDSILPRDRLVPCYKRSKNWLPGLRRWSFLNILRCLDISRLKLMCLVRDCDIPTDDRDLQQNPINNLNEREWGCFLTRLILQPFASYFNESRTQNWKTIGWQHDSDDHWPIQVSWKSDRQRSHLVRRIDCRLQRQGRAQRDRKVYQACPWILRKRVHETCMWHYLGHGWRPKNGWVFRRLCSLSLENSQRWQCK